MKDVDNTGSDSTAPKRGAIPTPRSEIERAQHYVPEGEHVEDQDDRRQGE